LYRVGFLFIAVACLAYSTREAVGSGTQTPTSAIGTASPKQWSTEPLNLDSSMLGPDFAGNDAEAVYNALAALKNKLTKDEFETTAQYQQRVREATDATLIGNFKLTSVYAFRVKPFLSLDVAYNADTQQMTVTVSADTVMTGTSRDDSTSGVRFDHSRVEVKVKSVDRGGRTYAGTNAFGAVMQVTSSAFDSYQIAFRRLNKDEYDLGIGEKFSLALAVKPDAAVTLKPNIAVLALVSLDTNSSYAAEYTTARSATVQYPHEEKNTKKLILCKLVDLWVFDERDGKVLSKFSNSKTRATE
jgi:hypothetical protein